MYLSSCLCQQMSRQCYKRARFDLFPFGSLNVRTCILLHQGSLRLLLTVSACFPSGLSSVFMRSYSSVHEFISGLFMFYSTIPLLYSCTQCSQETCVRNSRLASKVPDGSKECLECIQGRKVMWLIRGQILQRCLTQN